MKWKIKILGMVLSFGVLIAVTGCNPSGNMAVSESNEIAEERADLTLASEQAEAETGIEEGVLELQEAQSETNIIYVTINEQTVKAVLTDNSSADALYEKLAEGDITIDMHDYSNFEKVGSLGFDLPRNDESITTKAGDIILYQGDQLVFYYDTNSWNFTKLGEFQDISEEALRQLFGDGTITATLSASE